MNRRQRDILQILLQKTDYCSSQYLAEKCQVSTKTIYLDLAILESFIASYGLNLDKIPRHGIRIYGTNNAKYALMQELENHAIHFRKDYQFLDREDVYFKSLFLVDQPISILDLSLNLFISESSVRRDLEKIGTDLSYYHCQLMKEGGGAYVQGEEVDIRHFLRNAIIDKYAGQISGSQYKEILLKFFTFEEICQVEQIIQKISDLYAYTISEQYRLYLFLDLLIAATRIRQGKNLEHKILGVGEDIKLFGMYPLASELLSHSLGIPIEQLLPEEIKQIALTILSVGYTGNALENEEFEQLSIQFIERVSHLSGLDLTKDKDLTKMITNHMRPMIYRLKNDINISNQTTEEIKKRYSILFNIVWLASKILSDQYHLRLLDAEIAFLTIYFEIAVEKLEKPLTIIIVCPHGLATSELIISSLKRIISHYDHILKIDLEDLSSSIIKQADIVISSIVLEKFSSPYVLVSPILTNEELDRIQKQYLTLTKGNRKVLSIIHDNNALRQTLLKELIQENIYLKQFFSNQTTCINYLAQQSYQENYQNPDYLNSILQREKLGSTSVYTGIALPHANPETVNRSQLSLMTLQEPILWGQNKVKVVLLISIKEGEEAFYKDALIHLYSKIDNDAFIEQLATADRKENFLEILLEKEER